MRIVSIVSKRIMRIISVSLAYHDLKSEFLNSFVSVGAQRINRIIFVRVGVCLLKPMLKEKDNNKSLGSAGRKKGNSRQKSKRGPNPLGEGYGDFLNR